MSAANGREPDRREVYRCAHWTWHRMAARGLVPYSEATVLADEWMIHGGPPPEVLAAIERGEPDLTPWCPILRPGVVG